VIDGTVRDVSGGYALEPAELDAIGRFLGDAEGELADQAASVSASPDAGRSTDEVAKAFGTVSVAVGALAERIAGISSALADNVAQYREAEDRVSGTYGPGGVGP